MAKRKLEEVGDVPVKKHTLDSDEEEDADSTKYDIMDEDDIEGQEDATIEFDGDIKITPFNMKEELEEGHFDKDGNYFLKKQEQVRDSWLDNIDWAKVHSKSNQDATAEHSSDSDSYEPVDELETYKQMLALMEPKENILKAIKRLGGQGSQRANASSRWNLKKKTTKAGRKTKKEAEEPAKDTVTPVAPMEVEEESEGTRKMLALTELANRMLHSGRLEIYSETYERLSFLVRQRSAGRLRPAGDDDVPDMFGDDFQEKVVEPQAGSSQEEPGDGSSTGAKRVAESLTSDQIMWQFKWEDKEEAEVYGPHPTAEMQQWVSDGYFADGVWVRRADQPEASFYTSKRVDFELYM